MKFVSYLAPGFPASLFELAAETIGAEISFVTEASGPLPGQDPFATGQVDIGWMCSISYANLMAALDPSIELAGVAWVSNDPDANGEPVYFGDLVVAADSPVDSFEQLCGTRLGCNDTVSLSGLYALQFELQKRGLGSAEAFADLVFTGGHATSLEMLLAGELDAATIDSIVRLRGAASDPRIAGLRVIKRMGPWPVQPLVVRAGIDAAERLRIRDSLIEASQRADFQAELRAAGLTSLVAVDATHYDSVMQAARSFKQPTTG